MKMSKTKILVVKDYANYCTELIGLLKDSGCFDVLPPVVKDAVYRRLWDVLSAHPPLEKYGHLSAADRAAIVDILQDTKSDLPGYWK